MSPRNIGAVHICPWCVTKYPHNLWVENDVQYCGNSVSYVTSVSPAHRYLPTVVKPPHIIYRQWLLTINRLSSPVYIPTATLWLVELYPSMVGKYFIILRCMHLTFFNTYHATSCVLNSFPTLCWILVAYS